MSGLKLKSVPFYPSRVDAGLGIDVTKQNGNYIISIDYDDLAFVSPYVPKSTDYVLVWDSVANSYFLVTATDLHA
jgi:hypothetical protein